MADEECAEHDDENHDGPKHVAVVLGSLLPEVDQYNTDAVECVINDRSYRPDSPSAMYQFL